MAVPYDNGTVEKKKRIVDDIMGVVHDVCGDAVALVDAEHGREATRVILTPNALPHRAELQRTFRERRMALVSCHEEVARVPDTRMADFSSTATREEKTLVIRREAVPLVYWSRLLSLGGRLALVVFLVALLWHVYGWQTRAPPPGTELEF